MFNLINHEYSTDYKRILSSEIEGNLNSYIDLFFCLKKIRLISNQSNRRYVLESTNVDFYSGNLNSYFEAYSAEATDTDSFKIRITGNIINYLDIGFSTFNWGYANKIEFVLESLPT